jgi:hypothetical protein
MASGKNGNLTHGLLGMAIALILAPRKARGQAAAAELWRENFQIWMCFLTD